MNVLVVGTGGAIVSGISAAADEMVKTLTAMGHGAERLNAGEHMRRRSNTINLENVVAVLTDALRVVRRARQGRADVVWIHTFGLPALPALRALAMAAGARMAGRPAVVHFHAFGLERSVAESGRPLRMAIRALGLVANAVVAVHQAAAESLSGIVDASSVHVLPNWVEVPNETAVLPLQPPLHVVFVGGLVRRKGVPQLIESMRALKGVPVELRLVGGAGEDGLAALERLHSAAADLVTAGCVSFAGERDSEGVRSELRAAHLLVLPSEAEGMPISLLEAMAEGRAVLVADAGNMKTLVEETGCGWVLPDRDPATIATYLRQVLSDPIALAKASAAARHAASARYSAEAQRDRIESLLSLLPRR